MKCAVCGFEEHDNKKFVGIFGKGISFITTDKLNCAIFGCPECGCVIFTTDYSYIQKRKEQYKGR